MDEGYKIDKKMALGVGFGSINGNFKEGINLDNIAGEFLDSNVTGEVMNLDEFLRELQGNVNAGSNGVQTATMAVNCMANVINRVIIDKTTPNAVHNNDDNNVPYGGGEKLKNNHELDVSYSQYGSTLPSDDQLVSETLDALALIKLPEYTTPPSQVLQTMPPLPRYGNNETFNLQKSPPTSQHRFDCEPVKVELSVPTPIDGFNRDPAHNKWMPIRIGKRTSSMSSSSSWLSCDPKIEPLDEDQYIKTLMSPVIFSKDDLRLASVGGKFFDPTTRRFSDEELKPQPIIRKRRKQLVPIELKNPKYWERRCKNNEAAKRSREVRRLKENQISLRARYLEEENVLLKKNAEILSIENEELKNMVSMLNNRIKQYQNCSNSSPSSSLSNLSSSST